MNYFAVSVRSCFLQGLRDDSEHMFYAVLEAVTFCQAALFHVADMDQLPDVRNNQA